jgi:hypothetical protein
MDAAFFRAKAKQCRRLAEIATNREIREALLNLAREFDQQAGDASTPAQRPGPAETAC